jgi:hypothetical protein
MSWGRIANDDRLFRLCTFPIAFKTGKKKCIFEPKKVMYIEPQDDGSLAASLAWQRFVPTADLVHQYGCRLSRGINKKKKDEGKYSDAKRNVYCGSYQLRASDVRDLPSNVQGVVFADVYHQIENDEFAHAHLRILLEANWDSEGTKTAILVWLWGACYGPLAHICDCDKHLNPHPHVDLGPGPRGPYHDTRSRFERWRAVLRFRVCNWLWQKFFR